jgi:hypothetical protein
MKRLGLIAMVVGVLLLPTVLQAGTFENTDPNDYQYEVIINGVPAYGTLYGNSALYGFCDEGCELILTSTGQTIQMKPDDHIVINNGTMQPQND